MPQLDEVYRKTHLLTNPRAFVSPTLAPYRIAGQAYGDWIDSLSTSKGAQGEPVASGSGTVYFGDGDSDGYDSEYDWYGDS